MYLPALENSLEGRNVSTREDAVCLGLQVFAVITRGPGVEGAENPRLQINNAEC